MDDQEVIINSQSSNDEDDKRISSQSYGREILNSGNDINNSFAFDNPLVKTQPSVSSIGSSSFITNDENRETYDEYGRPTSWRPPNRKERARSLVVSSPYIVEMLICGLIRCSIPKRMTVGDHIEYVMRIIIGVEKEAFFIRKRYSDFEILNEIVTENWYIPSDFPVKSIMSFLPANDGFLDKRQQQLEEWTNSLLATFQGSDMAIVPPEVVEFFAKKGSVS